MMRRIHQSRVWRFARTISILATMVLFNQNIFGQQISNSGPRINGIIGVGAFNYQASGLAPRQPEWGYSLQANLQVSLYGIDIPITASMNEQGSQFSNPFNRFGISPRYKWAQLHLGWRNMRFSSFTLQGVTFLGAGVDLTPGKWRLSGMYGRFQEAADGLNVNYRRPQYERKGWAAKIGYGSSMNFFEFTLFKAEDDITTLALSDSNEVSAHENLCIGMNTQFEIVPNYLQAGIEMGLSGFTEDVRSDSLPEEAQKYVDQYSWAFAPNISSHFNYALQSFLEFKIRGFELRAQHRRIMPEYRSLGVNYLLNDIEAYTLEPKFRSKNGKWNIHTSIGRQKNNLDGWRQNENTRWIGSVALDYNPSPYFGISTQYSNYSFNQQVIRDSIPSDSFQLRQVNQNIVVMPRWIIQNQVFNHIITINYNGQQLSDDSALEGGNAGNSMQMIQLNYSLHQKKSKARYTFGTNYFTFKSDLAEIRRIGCTIGYRKVFLKDKINIRLNAGYQHALNDLNHHGYVGLNGTIKLYKKLRLQLQSRLRRALRDSKHQQEIRSEIRLIQQF